MKKRAGNPTSAATMWHVLRTLAKRPFHWELRDSIAHGRGCLTDKPSIVRCNPSFPARFGAGPWPLAQMLLPCQTGRLRRRRRPTCRGMRRLCGRSLRQLFPQEAPPLSRYESLSQRSSPACLLKRRQKSPLPNRRAKVVL